MSGNLVPEQRTDKNGVTRTRWVKPTAKKTGGRTLGAPSVASQKPSKEDDLRELESVLYVVPSSRRNTFMLNATDKDIAACAQAIRDGEKMVIMESIGNDDRIAKTASIALMIHDGIYPGGNPGERYRSAKHALGDATLYYLATTNQAYSLVHAPLTIQQRVQKFAVLQSVLAEIGQKPNVELVRLALRKQPKQFDTIVDLIREHRTSDAGRIELMLSNGVSALSDGVL